MKKIRIVLLISAFSFLPGIPAVAALSDVKISIVDSGGNPLPYGDLYWTTPNNQFHSVGSFFSNNKGEVTVKNMFLGQVSIQGYWIDRKKQTVFEGNWVVDTSSKEVNLVAPEFPLLKKYEVAVRLPNGLPVPGAVVVLGFTEDINNEESSVTNRFARQYFNEQGFTGSFVSMCAIADDGSTDCPGARGSNNSGIHMQTDENGIATFKGFGDVLDNEAIGSQVYAYFSDDSTYQQTEPVEFKFHLENSISLEYMPWFETKDKEISGTYGKLVPIEVQLNESNSQVLSNRDYSGYSVRISPPAGAKNKACTSKPKLNATTNASGIAKFKVCASKSGKYQVTSPGVVSSASINLKVKGAPPGRPSVSSYETPAKKTIELSVIAPAYTGGAKITKYKFVVYGSEKGGSKQFTKTFFVKNPKNVQKVRLTGINSYGPSSVKVYAITKNGTGDYVEVWPTLW